MQAEPPACSQGPGSLSPCPALLDQFSDAVNQFGQQQSAKRGRRDRPCCPSAPQMLLDSTCWTQQPTSFPVDPRQHQAGYSDSQSCNCPFCGQPDSQAGGQGSPFHRIAEGAVTPGPRGETPAASAPGASLGVPAPRASGRQAPPQGDPCAWPTLWLPEEGGMVPLAWQDLASEPPPGGREPQR